MCKKNAFTLIELIVVIAIIAILAAIIAPNAFRAIEKAKVANVISTAKAIKTALYNYYTDTGQWPPRLSADSIYLNINSFLRDDGVAGWDGPYLEKWNTHHPWGGTWFVRMDTSGSDALNPGVVDIYLGLNNDPPGPNSAYLKIDSSIDDGVLTTGYVRAACSQYGCELHVGIATVN